MFIPSESMNKSDDENIAKSLNVTALLFDCLRCRKLVHFPNVNWE